MDKGVLTVFLSNVKENAISGVFKEIVGLRVFPGTGSLFSLHEIEGMAVFQQKQGTGSSPSQFDLKLARLAVVR